MPAPAAVIAEKEPEDPPQRPRKKAGGGNKKAGGGGGNKGAGPRVVEVAPIARRAKMRKRHWGIVFGFVLMVVLPLVVSAWYLWTRAADQYASTVGFTVRQESGGGASDFLTGFTAQLGGGGQNDTDILYEFIQSQNLVAAIDEKFDLRAIYSAPRDNDPVFALGAESSLEELTEYWQRIVRASYDVGSQLIELRVLAFDPDVAQQVAQEILDQSAVLINELNAQAREDTIQYAEIDLADALKRLREARAELIRFRTESQLVDPETDLQGRMGVVNTLQGQLAEALVELDLLVQTTQSSDPRVVQARRRIEVIRDRISQERANVASGADQANGQDYPTLLAEYEALVVDREFAEQSYTAALTALDVARADASRQSRYLSVYVSPTRPETAEFPQRWVLLGLVTMFTLLAWGIVTLVYYSVRDSR